MAWGRNRTGNRANRRIFFTDGVLCFRVSALNFKDFLPSFQVEVGAISLLAPGKINFQALRRRVDVEIFRRRKNAQTRWDIRVY